MKSNLLYIFIFFSFSSCATQDQNFNINKINQSQTYLSKGFTLIYQDKLYNEKLINKKLDNKSNFILHSFLKPKTLVNVYNPYNSRNVIAEVKYNTNYPSFFNSVITKKIANDLELDFEDPYVEIVEIKKNDMFIAKKAKTFDEEKVVANKAPISDIKVQEISKSKKKILTKENKKYIISIAEFYFYDSALNLLKMLKKDTNLDNFEINKIAKNKFRVYSGPYNSFNSMKDSYLIIDNLGFELLNVIKIK